MSPTIFTESFMEPIQVPGRRLGARRGQLLRPAFRIASRDLVSWFSALVRLFSFFDRRPRTLNPLRQTGPMAPITPCNIDTSTKGSSKFLFGIRKLKIEERGRRPASR